MKVSFKIYLKKNLEVINFLQIMKNYKIKIKKANKQIKN